MYKANRSIILRRCPYVYRTLSISKEIAFTTESMSKNSRIHASRDPSKTVVMVYIASLRDADWDMVLPPYATPNS